MSQSTAREEKRRKHKEKLEKKAKKRRGEEIQATASEILQAEPEQSVGDSEPKVSKKRKREVADDDTGAIDQPATEPKKRKRRRKNKDTAKEVNGAKADAEGGDGGNGEPQQTTEETSTKKGERFIVFIGNLPFSATADSISKHFASVRPNSVRAITDKKNGKSKGFAFLEFDGYDRMKTCLKLYHHSSFNDGSSPARKINVELTAGGGGAKSESRKSKLQAKNEKLNEERRRRMQEEERAKKRQEKEKKKAAQEGAEEGASSAAVRGPALSGDDSGIHPSRRAQIKS